ncbi:MAG: hypothetical protein WC619_02175 [Patescibacteria group bacterium]
MAKKNEKPLTPEELAMEQIERVLQAFPKKAGRILLVARQILSEPETETAEV